MYDITEFSPSQNSDTWKYFTLPGHYVISRPNSSLTSLQQYSQLEKSQIEFQPVELNHQISHPIQYNPSLLLKEFHPNLLRRNPDPISFYKKLREAHERYIDNLNIK